MLKNELIEIRKKLSKLLFNFTEETSNEGLLVIYDGDLVEGLAVYTYDADGNKIALPDGVYSLPGKSIEVANGVISKITLDQPSNEPVTEQKETVASVEASMSKEEKEKFENEFKTLNNKLAEMAGFINKLNDAIIQFGNENQKENEPKKTKIEDIKTTIDASKFFPKK
jgi:hypothetical protein